ncbi:leucine zipper domain-containing protein [Castellaniella sp.]|uniref:leucine zipper domain-containing protein n=1 Tax=Castellaniella sp. TaxID=1955812 RepID=UPI003A93E678
MNNHKGARLTPHSRALLVRRMTQDGLRAEEAAHAAGVSVRTAYKWLRRFRDEGPAGLQNRSSRPLRCLHETSVAIVRATAAQRHARRTYRQIAQSQGIAPSTVGRWLGRLGLNRLAALEPAAPVYRYEHEAPGDLLHLDIKKLGRFHKPGHRVTGSPHRGKSYGAGWEYVHVAIDDHSRVAFATIQPNQTGRSAARALPTTLRYYRALGVRFARVMTDTRAGIENLKFHDLQHEAASRFAKRIPAPATLAKIMEWKTLQMAMRYYNPTVDELVEAVLSAGSGRGDPAELRSVMIENGSPQPGGCLGGVSASA